MPQYIMLVNFTDQGLKGVKDVPNRQDKSRETAKKFGVQRKTVWMTFGPYDFVHLYEAPNDEAMAKFVMTLASFGNLRTTVMRAWDESEHLPLIRELSSLANHARHQAMSVQGASGQTRPITPRTFNKKVWGGRASGWFGTARQFRCFYSAPRR